MGGLAAAFFHAIFPRWKRVGFFMFVVKGNKNYKLGRLIFRNQNKRGGREGCWGESKPTKITIKLFRFQPDHATPPKKRDWKYWKSPPSTIDPNLRPVTWHPFWSHTVKRLKWSSCIDESGREERLSLDQHIPRHRSWLPRNAGQMDLKMRRLFDDTSFCRSTKIKEICPKRIYILLIHYEYD